MEAASSSTNIISRRLAQVITARLREEAVVIVTGARTVGKSTLLNAYAAEHGVTVVDLDIPDVRQAVAQDPTLFVSGSARPICMDEFQHVPALLDAIKGELNQGLEPGRFLLTGSTSYTTLPRASQSLTGRADVLTVWPLSQGELAGQRDDFVARAFDAPDHLLAKHATITTRADYEKAILVGGFPVALWRPAGEPRLRWFRNFIKMVIERDVLDIRRVRDRDALPQVLRHLASRTGQLLNIAEIGNKMGVEARTVSDYVTLLEAVFLVHRLPAYGRTLSARVGRTPKVHLVDTGLAAYLLGITQERLDMRDLSALAQFGHLVETFVVNELIKQSSWTATPVTFGHFRTKDQAEVDLVLEATDGRVIGIEIKAAATITDRDFGGLRLLQLKLGNKFVAGYLINLGQHAYRYADQLYVTPADRIWA